MSLGEVKAGRRPVDSRRVDRLLLLSLGTLLLLAAAEGVRAEEPPALPLRLEEILLPAAAVAGRWEVVDEAPTDPANDPDLVRWGVRAQRARHYTRDGVDGVQVCSIEIWSFENEGRARLAQENFRYPGWRFERQQHLLIMLRALTQPRQGPPHRKLFRDCLRLGDRTSARVATRLTR
jgi:hypothetical protein